MRTLLDWSRKPSHKVINLLNPIINSIVNKQTTTKKPTWLQRDEDSRIEEKSATSFVGDLEESELDKPLCAGVTEAEPGGGPRRIGPAAEGVGEDGRRMWWWWWWKGWSCRCRRSYSGVRVRVSDREGDRRRRVHSAGSEALTILFGLIRRS